MILRSLCAAGCLLFLPAATVAQLALSVVSTSPGEAPVRKPLTLTVELSDIDVTPRLARLAPLDLRASARRYSARASSTVRAVAGGSSGSGGDKSARQILDERFARGEIDQREYEERRHMLE